MKALDGKKALVTGGASGIGAATARALAARGAAVVVADRDVDLGHEVALEIGGEFLALDVSDPASWESVSDDIDLAHLNAGIATAPLPVSLDDLTITNWQRIRGVNLDGVVFGLATLLNGMQRRGRGSIVCTSSGAGLGAFPPDPFYAATKHAITALTRSVAPALAAFDVAMNVVCPPRTETPMMQMVKEPDRSDRPRLSADAVGAVVVQILAGEAPGRKTGEVYRIEADGSFHPHEFLGDLGPPPT